MTTFIRYIIAGGIAAGVHFLVLIFLVELFNSYPPVASAIGFIIACMVNYTLQYHWTFKTQGSHKVMMTRYTLVTSLTFCVNLGIFWMLYELIGLQYIVSQFISTGVVTIINYLINKHYTFNSDSLA